MRLISTRFLVLAVLVALKALAFSPLAAAQQGNDLGAARVADPDPARFAAEIRAFEEWDRKNAFPRDAVLFVGSSSIRMWPTAESFSGIAVINRGFGGSHSSDVNHFAERIVLKYAPRVVVFYAGDNDVEADKPPQQVFDDFQAFVKLIHERLPATTVVYLPIKPSLARWAKWSRMQDVNARVERLSRGDKSLLYVDTASPMLGDDGRPRPELFLDDGLHLNSKGYQEWTTVVNSAIQKLLSRKPIEHRAAN